MMWTNKIITFIIVGILMFVGLVRTDGSNDILLPQFVGRRYVMSIAVLEEVHERFSCGVMKVARNIVDRSQYNASVSLWSNGNPFILRTHGSIVEFDIHYTIDPAQTLHLTSRVMVIGKGRDLIIFPSDGRFDKHFPMLMSRGPSVSEIAKSLFRRLSEDADLNVVDISHHNCDYWL